MTWYLHAYIVDGQVGHVHCSDAPIDQPALEVEGQPIIVSAQVSGEYQSAGSVLPLLSWDGQALSGVPITSQQVGSQGV